MAYWIGTEHVTFSMVEARTQPCIKTTLARRWRWAGAAFVVVHVAIFLLSSQFNTTRPLADRPVLLLVGLEIFVGLLWLTAVWLSRGSKGTKVDMLYLVLVGMILRGIMLFSTPILEDDFWRYLWDGAVVAHGYSPYTQAPQEFLTGAETPYNHQSGLYALTREGHEVLEHINHPSLRTIYPPLAQVAFAVAHGIGPWSLIAWRVVLLVFDIATFMLVLRLLRDLGLPAMGAVIYWWNPLLIKESVNAAHMDVLALPFVLGALLLAFRKKPIWAVAVMSLAIGIKLWPVILLPFLFRSLVGSPRRFVTAMVVVGFVLALVTWPAVYRILEPNSGFAAYAEHWEMNDATKAGRGLRLKHDLAKKFHGKYPPWESLSYVWSSQPIKASFYDNPNTKRAKMIPLRAGKHQLGEWVDEQVNVLADYRKTFGKDLPGRASLVIMNDSDNTGQAAVSHMDFIEVRSSQSVLSDAINQKGTKP
jgi:hypothetical protein